MACNSAASSVDGFIYVAMNAFYHATLSFTSQNMGAKRYDRLNKVLFSCVASVIVTGLTVSTIIYSLGPKLLSLYVPSTDPNREAVISAGMIRLMYVGLPYFLCGLMEVATGALRGIGKSWTPLIISLIGGCLLRIIWVATVFKAFPKLTVLYLSYPITWFITPTIHFIALYFARKKMKIAEPTERI
jgi:Na+-driven multidrug efflux pump